MSKIATVLEIILGDRHTWKKLVTQMCRKILIYIKQAQIAVLQLIFGTHGPFLFNGKAMHMVSDWQIKNCTYFLLVWYLFISSSPNVDSLVTWVEITNWPKNKQIFPQRGFYVPHLSINCLACPKGVKYKYEHHMSSQYFALIRHKIVLILALKKL